MVQMVGRIGMRTRNLMSLCMVGLNCLFAILFVCLLVWLFLLGCVCARMFAVAFAFILEDCVLPCQSVILLHLQRCVF